MIIAHWDSADAHHRQANELLLRFSGEEIAAARSLSPRCWSCTSGQDGWTQPGRP